MEPLIRPYRETDLSDVVRLSLRAWAPVHSSLRDVMGDEIFKRLYGDDWRRRQQRDVEAALADKGAQIWAAEMNGTVVGFAVAVLKVDDGMGEIYMVAVDPDFQNQGLGTRLTDVATEWIRDSGLSLAFISTGGDIGHAPARRAYEKAEKSEKPKAGRKAS